MKEIRLAVHSTPDRLALMNALEDVFLVNKTGTFVPSLLIVDEDSPDARYCIDEAIKYNTPIIRLTALPESLREQEPKIAHTFEKVYKVEDVVDKAKELVGDQ